MLLLASQFAFVNYLHISLTLASKIFLDSAVMVGS
jgi:hypothetical protein